MTAGNSTPLTDGASAVLLGTRGVGRRARADRRWRYFVDGETAAVDYVTGDEGLLMAPAYAVPRLLARNGLSLQDFDFYEIHEAFAARCSRTLAAWEDEEFCSERLGLDAPLGAIDRSSSTSTARRSPPATRSPPPAGGSSPPWPSCSHEKGPGARPDLDLRRRRPGRRRDPRGGLRWRTATATRPSSPPGSARSSPTTLGLPQPVALRRQVPGRPLVDGPVLVGGHGDTPGAGRAARRPDRAPARPSSTSCPRPAGSAAVVVDLTAADGPRPTSSRCGPRSARR